MTVARLSDVEDFVAKLTPIIHPDSTIEILPGPKNFKLAIVNGPSRSVYAFIERETGAILKAEGWSRPAKGVRGNIFNDNPTSACGQFGVAYLR